ncbi:MAG TPA: hypothetical protein VGX28_16025 [Frankiaceae bacterium]|nr:hypothetical protein [Frankiaceae bacterium]
MPVDDEADGDPRLRLVYEESLRAVQDQQRSLDNLRSRAAQLLTAAAVVETFLVGLVLGAEGRPRPATWVGAGAFVALALICVWIVLPRKGWTFSNSATILLDAYVDAEPAASLDEMYRNLAIYNERHWDRNQDELLNKRLVGLQVAAALLVVCILSSVVDLRGRNCDGQQRGSAATPSATPTPGPGQARGQGGPAPC